MPATIRVSLEVGGTNETVIVEAGVEIVQSQTANVTTTLGASQIINLPLISRNALDFLVLLARVNTPDNTNGNSTINGLPEAMINITIDGVSSIDKYNGARRDGFFSRVRPSLDSIEEVTVSTATSGAENGARVWCRSSS